MQYQRIYNFPKQAFDLRLEKEIREEEEKDEMLEDEEEEEVEEGVEMEEEEEREGISVKNEEMEQELVDELERDLVRLRRQEDSVS